jgi:hypothetical protein
MRNILCAVNLVMLCGCAPSPGGNSTASPINLKATIDGSHILLFYSVEPGTNLCVNGRGLLPTPIDTYPDHGPVGKITSKSDQRLHFFRSFFSRDGTLATLQVWRNNGATSIDISEWLFDKHQDGRLEINIEMARCEELFSDREIITKHTFYQHVDY